MTSSHPGSHHRKPTISLIMPALNEALNIKRTVTETLDIIPKYFSDYELLLINDGSSDQTGSMMEELAETYSNIRVFHNDRNLGLGASYRLGLSKAQYEYVTIVFSDGGLPPSNLVPLFEKLGQRDIIIAYVKNLRLIKSFSRFLISRSYTLILNFLFGLSIRYYNGSAIYRRDLLRKIEITSERFGFQAEILIKSIKLGASYLEIGVDGAVGKTDAVRIKNFVNVGKTIANLIVQIWQLNSSVRSLKTQDCCDTKKVGSTRTR